MRNNIEVLNKIEEIIKVEINEKYYENCRYFKDCVNPCAIGIHEQMNKILDIIKEAKGNVKDNNK